MAANKLFIITGASGTGKTSLLKQVLTSLSSFSMLVSHTTRPPRKNEEHNRDYHFVQPEAFNQMLKRKDFIEHANIFGYYYGTAHRELEEKLARGNKVIFEIDWQGAQQIKRSISNTFSIFILPPSLAILRERLEKRDQNSPSNIALRLEMACEEIDHYHEFDALIVNDDFDRACKKLKALLLEQVIDPAEQALAKKTLQTLLKIKTT